MTSSKTGGRKPATRKALPQKPATKARLAEAAQQDPATSPELATEGAPPLDISDKSVTPPQTLAGGQGPSPGVVAPTPGLGRAPPHHKKTLVRINICSSAQQVQ